MKTTIIICFCLFMLLMLFTANTTIQFHPFKISFERPYFAIGCLLIIAGIYCINYDCERTAIKKIIKSIETINEKENNK